MKYLVDTHIFIWSLFTPNKIPQTARRIIKDSVNRIFVSTITFWEISLKYSLNKLNLEGTTPEELPQFAVKMNFEILSFKAEDTASFYRLPRISHKDPFDRMIVWLAIREQMVLISKDSKIPSYEKYGLTQFISHRLCR